MGEQDLRERIAAVVGGLAAADGITWPAWWHRLSQLPPRREVRLGEAWTHARAGHTSSLPTPYLQSSSPALVDPAGPTDDLEWFVVAVRHHLGQRLDGSASEQSYAVWKELAHQRAADTDQVRGRIGTVMALENLAAGLTPPATGNDTPHYFDDIACVRGVAAGLLSPGHPDGAATLAARDAEVTHALDGVWASRATAALVAGLVGGVERDAAIDRARAELPVDSWCAAVVAECLAVAESLAVSEAGVGPLALAARLEREAVDHVYGYANQAPETLGLLLAHLRTARDGSELLLGALAHPRHADALVPLAGAVAGAVFGDVGFPEPPPELAGVCVRALAGTMRDAIVAGLVGAATRRAEVRA
ncbi:ADP-ribosylglycohydrolase family protein [Actinopolymorpha sp. B9G3]|uniref:ADP-ribosylglycohydrolase family protein n=1 Tax=Actinopolymorpha sp. B9G3 TaxID=3158970 RepID=UPI0032D8FE49